MSENDKPAEQASANRAGREGDPNPYYRTAEELTGGPAQGKPTPGLSQSPGLVEVPNSRVPGLGNGGMISHVMGPGQAPADPIAAGLDTAYVPKTRAEQIAPTLTGTDGAGPRPSTYAEKPDGLKVPQSTEATGETVAPVVAEGGKLHADAKPVTAETSGQVTAEPPPPPAETTQATGDAAPTATGSTTEPPV